jgi:hypothetical protein
MKRRLCPSVVFQTKIAKTLEESKGEINRLEEWKKNNKEKVCLFSLRLTF